MGLSEPGTTGKPRESRRRFRALSASGPHQPVELLLNPHPIERVLGLTLETEAWNELVSIITSFAKAERTRIEHSRHRTSVRVRLRSISGHLASFLNETYYSSAAQEALRARAIVDEIWNSLNASTGSLLKALVLLRKEIDNRTGAKALLSPLPVHEPWDAFCQAMMGWALAHSVCCKRRTGRVNRQHLGRVIFEIQLQLPSDLREHRQTEQATVRAIERSSKRRIRA